MNLINNTDEPLSSDLDSLLEKVEDKHNLSFEEPAVVTKITENGLAIVEVGYSGEVNISGTRLNPVENPELYSSTLGDVSLLSFSDSELTLQVYDRA